MTQFGSVVVLFLSLPLPLVVGGVVDIRYTPTYMDLTTD